MLTFDDALADLLAVAQRLPGERVPLADTVGRVLAEEVRADRDQPPFAKAAMDGWACRRADLPGPLRLIGEIPAGAAPTRTLRPGECASIMTGAPLPEGADCVLMLEHGRCADGLVTGDGTPTADNFCPQGEDARAGDVLLRAGRRLGPIEIAVLASAGIARPLVACRPRVAVISTGSELSPVDQTPGPSGIRDSNSHQLAAQIAGWGATVTRRGPIADREADLRAAFAAVGDHQVLVLSGGVSTGDYDLVPAALAACGFTIRFDSVAMQPGKPMTCATRPGAVAIGLPGNPVSTLVVAELFLRPFLAAMQGEAFAPRRVAVRLGEEVRRRKADRRLTLPVRFTDPGTMAPVAYHGSAHIAAYLAADALLTLDVGVGVLPAGQVVDVRLL